MVCIGREQEMNTIIGGFNELLLSESNNVKHIYNIFGVKNIGKTFLLNKLLAQFTKADTDIKILSLTLYKKNYYAKELIEELRWQISENCPLFDYAYYLYQDYYSPTFPKISKRKIEGEFIYVFLNIVLDSIANVPLPIAMLKSIPYNSLINLISDINKKSMVREKYERILASLNCQGNSDVTKSIWTIFLDLFIQDIKKLYITNPFILFIDNSDFLESDNILFDFINKLDSGLVIIAGREEIPSKYLNGNKSFKLEPLEREFVTNYLQKEFEQKDFSLIPRLFPNVCMPIILEKCVSMYNRIKNENKKYIENTLKEITNKKIDEPYIEHLNENIQDIIHVLEIVGLFNEELYRTVFNISQYSTFKKICNFSFIEQIKKSNNTILFRIKDCAYDKRVSVFSEHQQAYILDTFLEKVVSNIEIMNSPDIISELFLNFIDRYNALSSNVTFKITCKERLMHLFFGIYGYLENNIIIEKINTITNHQLEDIKKAIVYIINCFNNENIENIEIENFNLEDYAALGSYKSSTQLARANHLCYTGQYNEGMKTFEELYKNISFLDTQNWVYGKVIINNADAKLMKGNFKGASETYTNNFLNISSWNIRNTFDKKRQLAHIFRFNMDLDIAKENYLNIINEFSYSDSLKSHAIAGLHETLCYFEPQYVLEHFEDDLLLCSRNNSNRSKAKIYYAVGIAYTRQGDFEKAKKNIQQSIECNNIACYFAGNIFSYLAKGFYEYARYSCIKQTTIETIENLMNKLGVYQFLELPISLMTHDNKMLEKCRTKFSWIHFENTKEKYQLFLNLLNQGEIL